MNFGWYPSEAPCHAQFTELLGAKKAINAFNSSVPKSAIFYNCKTSLMMAAPKTTRAVCPFTIIGLKVKPYANNEGPCSCSFLTTKITVIYIYICSIPWPYQFRDLQQIEGSRRSVTSLMYLDILIFKCITLVKLAVICVFFSSLNS